jgi:cytochrome c biogenesis protein CcmG/thiol:disulfide interchange protein DsbE
VPTNRNKRRFSLVARAARIVSVFVLTIVGNAGFAQEGLLNRPAPPFTRTDLENGRVSLASYRGKVVLLNFWATWCGPCIVEIPHFMEWQKQYGPRGLAVLGVSIDDDGAPVRAFAQKLHVNYPMVMGDARLGENYGGVLGVPVTFLIDRRGIIRARINGESDLHEMEEKIRALLAQPAE